MKAIKAVQGRVLRGRALRAGAYVALGVGTTVALGGGAWAALWVLAFIGVRPIGPAAAADRLDRVVDGDGAVRTAWDHRAVDHPMVRAQRRRIDARMHTDHVRAAAPAPHWAWALCLAALALPTLTPGRSVEPGVNAPSTVAAPGSGAVESTAAAPDSVAAQTPRTQKPRVGATPSSPSVPPQATPQSGGGDGGAKAEIAGVGASVGDRLALPATAIEVGLSPKTAQGIWLSGASGMRLPDPPVRVALAPPAGTPDDDITDPARPYPRRYHALIARWFANR